MINIKQDHKSVNAHKKAGLWKALPRLSQPCSVLFLKSLLRAVCSSLGLFRRDLCKLLCLHVAMRRNVKN